MQSVKQNSTEINNGGIARCDSSSFLLNPKYADGVIDKTFQLSISCAIIFYHKYKLTSFDNSKKLQYLVPYNPNAMLFDFIVFSTTYLKNFTLLRNGSTSSSDFVFGFDNKSSSSSKSLFPSK